MSHTRDDSANRDTSFHRQFMEYMGHEDPTSDAAASAKQRAQRYCTFHWVVCKWNSFSIRDVDTLAAMVVEATWTAQHTRMHRLYEIGNTRLLSEVFHLYLRKTLASGDPGLLHSLPLCRWVSHCVEWMYLMHMKLVPFRDVQKQDNDGVQHLANCFTHPAMAELVMVLAVLVKDWSLSRHTLRARTISGTLAFRLYFLFYRSQVVPANVVDEAKAKFHGMFAAEISRREGVPAPGIEDVVPSAEYMEFNDGLVVFNVQLGAWHSFENTLPRNINGYTINFVTLHATRTCTHTPRWDLVRKLLPLCSDKDIMLDVLMVAANLGIYDVTDLVLQRLVFDSQHPVIFSCFMSVIFSAREKNTAEILLRQCASYGLTTYWIYETSDIFSKQLPIQNLYSLTRLALKIGMVSYRDCYDYLQGLESSGDGSHRTFMSEIQAKGSRRMAEVCRLRISHAIGLHPERMERIKKLSLPTELKMMVMYLYT